MNISIKLNLNKLYINTTNGISNSKGLFMNVSIGDGNSSSD